MTRKYIKRISGYCPNINSEYYINIQYLEATSINAPTIIRKGKFFCDKSSNCKYNSECPLYHSASNN